MKKLLFIASLLISSPAFASTDVNFDTTATGTTSSYLANTLNAYWHDDTNFNLAIGNTALPTTVSQSGGGSNGTHNLAIGKTAGNSVTTGAQNLAVGSDALSSEQAGSGNVAIGSLALHDENGGSSNTVIGSNAALAAGISGASSSNTIIGANTASTLLSGSNNTLIGKQIGVSSFFTSNSIGIGYDSTVSVCSNCLNIGNAIRGVSLGSTPNIGIGNVSSPTARLHLPAGTATASTAPIKLTPGTLLTTPEDGALEYDGTHLYFTIGSTRSPIL